MAEPNRYGREEILRYLQHKMNAQEMHAFEKAMMNDPFFADAIEGYKKSDQQLAANHLKEIEKQLTGDRQKAKVIALRQEREWWKIAAIILLIVTGAAISYSVINNSAADVGTTQQIAQKESKEIPVAKDSIAPAESSTSLQEALHEELTTFKKSSPPFISPKPEPPFSTRQLSRTEKDSTIAAMEDQEEQAMLSAAPTMSTQKDYKDGHLNQAEAQTGAAQKTPEAKVAGLGNEEKLMAWSRSTAAERDSNVVVEVAVIGYGTKRKEVAEEAKIRGSKKLAAVEPKGGWKNFEDYVKRELQNFKSTNPNIIGQVAVEFSLDKKGTPIRIQVEESSDKTAAAKALEILKNGPDWEQTKNNSRVRVRINF